MHFVRPDGRFKSSRKNPSPFSRSYFYQFTVNDRIRMQGVWIPSDKILGLVNFGDRTQHLASDVFKGVKEDNCLRQHIFGGSKFWQIACTINKDFRTILIGKT